MFLLLATVFLACSCAQLGHGSTSGVALLSAVEAAMQPPEALDLWNCQATAERGDNHGEVDAAGAATITKVEKNGEELEEGTDYELSGQGSSSPEIDFAEALAEGDVIKVYGTSVQQDPDPVLTLSTE